MEEKSCLMFILVLIAPFALGGDGDVLVLTKDNFDDAVDDNKYLLVEFYADWCSECKRFGPEFERAAKLSADIQPKITFGKVDAVAEKELAEKYEIRAYPTMWFFKNGRQIPFKSIGTAEEVLSLLKKKLGYPATILKTADEAKRFKNSAEVVVIGFFKNNKTEEAEDFIEVAEEIDDIPFAVTSADEVFKKLKVKKDGVVLFKDFDDGRSEYLDMKEFIEEERYPMVMEFNQRNSRNIIDEDIENYCVMFLNDRNIDHLTFLSAFKNAAIFYEDKVRFFYANSDGEDAKMLLDLFGLTADDAPVIRFFKMKGDEIKKFKPETRKITEMSTRNFVQDVLDGDIKPYYKSQDLPVDWNAEPVKVLVKSNFRKIAMDKKKKVLVEFYAPWCGVCKKAAPIYEEMGEKYKNNKKVVIAKMDATLNEFEDFHIRGFPTFKLYKSGTNQVVDFKGDVNLESLIEFVESDGAKGGVEPKEKHGDWDDDDDHDHDEL